MDLPAFFRASGRWCGFVGSLLTFILGILHVLLIGAYIEVRKYTIKDDFQYVSWRQPLFSLDPAILMETWTPFIVGLAGMRAHMKSTKHFRFITEDFVNYFLWNVFEALFATMAYNGVLGVIFSVVVWLAALFCLLALIIDDGDASLELHVELSLKSRPT